MKRHKHFTCSLTLRAVPELRFNQHSATEYLTNVVASIDDAPNKIRQGQSHHHSTLLYDEEIRQARIDLVREHMLNAARKVITAYLEERL